MTQGWAWYNENDEFAADWLRNLIKAGLIADGEVDTRSIVDVRPSDLVAFKQCHFFAGIGGWSYALRAAGWDDNRPAWTGSCPCQPFSLAGAQRGFADERHLWPTFRRLIAECEPPVVFGEQVASATEWLGLVRSDLEEMGYAVGAVPIQAASAGADHLRDRYWFVADADDEGSQGWGLLPERAGQRAVGPDGVADADQSGASEERQQRGWQQCGPGCDPSPCIGGLAGAKGIGSGSRLREVGSIQNGDGATSDGGPVQLADAGCDEHQRQRLPPGPQRHSDSDVERGDGGGELSWVIGADGKARRVKPGIRLLAHGVPNRVGLLRGFGNAIDHRPAKEFIQAYMTTRRSTEIPSQQLLTPEN